MYKGYDLRRLVHLLFFTRGMTLRNVYTFVLFLRGYDLRKLVHLLFYKGHDLKKFVHFCFVYKGI